MKNLLFAGLAGVLTMAPGAAIAAIDSAPNSGTPVDVSFASPDALAAGLAGMKAPKARMGGHNMRSVRQMGGNRMKNMGGNRMKNMGGNRMKNMGGQRMTTRGNRGAGVNVRKGRGGYGRGYQRPQRGFQLPQTFIQPSYFIGNFGYYGLSQPSAGYGWSRYYDDAVLTDRRGVVYDTRYNYDWDRYNQGYSDGYGAGQASYDQSVFYSDERVMATPSAYRTSQPAPTGGTVYQGDWNGAYQQDGSYKGDWQGTYRGQDGQTYDGQYSGTFIGEGNAAPAGATYTEAAPHWGGGAPAYNNSGYENRGYDDRNDDMAYLAQCRKSSGIGGGVIGGAIGALAGNRIAGRGNRLGGTLIGGGVGAVAGAAIEQGTDRCRKLLKKYGEGERYTRRAPAPQYRPAPAPRYQPAPQYRPAPAPRAQYPSGWQGGYYYPAYYQQQQAPMVTTVVVQSQPVTTTTTTTIEEEVYYTEAAPVATKKRWKPAPKRVWKPRAKAAPAPVLKGCQQERCYYDD